MCKECVVWGIPFVSIVVLGLTAFELADDWMRPSHLDIVVTSILICHWLLVGFTCVNVVAAAEFSYVITQYILFILFLFDCRFTVEQTPINIEFLLSTHISWVSLETSPTSMSSCRMFVRADMDVDVSSENSCYQIWSPHFLKALVTSTFVRSQ